jgi:hypothetical protein
MARLIGLIGLVLQLYDLVVLAGMALFIGFILYDFASAFTH